MCQNSLSPCAPGSFHKPFGASQFTCGNIPGSGEFSMQTSTHLKTLFFFFFLPWVCPSLLSGFQSPVTPSAEQKQSHVSRATNRANWRGTERADIYGQGLSWLLYIITRERLLASRTFVEIGRATGSNCEQRGEKIKGKERQDFCPAAPLRVAIWPTHRCWEPRAQHLQNSVLVCDQI